MWRARILMVLLLLAAVPLRYVAPRPLSNLISIALLVTGVLVYRRAGRATQHA